MVSLRSTSSNLLEGVKQDGNRSSYRSSAMKDRALKKQGHYLLTKRTCEPGNVSPSHYQFPRLALVCGVGFSY